MLTIQRKSTQEVTSQRKSTTSHEHFSYFPFEFPSHREDLYVPPLVLIIRDMFEVCLNLSFISVHSRKGI